MNKVLLLENACKSALQNLRLSHRKFCDNKGNDSKEKLKSLLQAMLDEAPKKPEMELFAKATPRVFKKKDIKEKTKALPEDLTTEIVKATKEVAEHVGGDVQHTESELLAKLLLHKHQEETTMTNLTDLIVGMKIDRSKKQEIPTTRAQYVQKTLNNKQVKQYKDKRSTRKHTPRAGNRVELFGGVGLNIFQKDAQYNCENLLYTTEALTQRELKLAVMQPPENYFQKMILWTEQGKLWKFPIDNEQGLEEHGVCFTEHVFMDKHLEGWCPEKGPVRHFMELVCVGLSKNPYLTVQEKINHIEWFREYFNNKMDLLKEVGALPSSSVKQETIRELE
ncbi:28S ribosomal protein S31, mitochondrial-like [Ctenocephalides felis]|uniref:28S ribosomal protein S31, mitochondrial-like n=1 Tax=Ctenocephalides felis TaxID=7515 RepID=UPI000E6E12A3|nr:28S ribosomal protein S31, mitochondrial-like [Ctenocephalides felis]